MKKTLLLALAGLSLLAFTNYWGFFAHEKINRLAVFTLPPEMIGFYKKNIEYISRAAVNPDKRRYVLPQEASRHYLDVDHFDSLGALPRRWQDAVARYGEDTLRAHGVLPWHIYQVYLRLRQAFITRDSEQILKLSADLGHYISDAHVPLHTTENYNGQLTGQEGIHGFWESRLPELFSSEYDFFVGKATYIDDPQAAAWEVVAAANKVAETVLREERGLAASFEERRFSFETRGKTTVKVYAKEYAREYHRLLGGMVENQMRASVRMTGNFWFTAWVDAGQPDLRNLRKEKPAEDDSDTLRNVNILRPHE